MRDFAYPVTLTQSTDLGGFVVTFKDVPEAITQGEDLPDALWQAADCLEEAIAGRIRRGDVIPAPSKPRRGQRLVPVPAAYGRQSGSVSGHTRSGNQQPGVGPASGLR